MVWTPVTSVVSGFGAGPIGVVIYINDLDGNVHGMVSKFAHVCVVL